MVVVEKVFRIDYDDLMPFLANEVGTPDVYYEYVEFEGRNNGKLRLIKDDADYDDTENLIYAVWCQWMDAVGEFLQEKYGIYVTELYDFTIEGEEECSTFRAVVGVGVRRNYSY